MVDDLLDFTADEKVLGKPVANDLREGKLTLPVIFLLRRGGRRRGRQVADGAGRPRLRPRVARGDCLRLAPRARGARGGARAGRALRGRRRGSDLAAFERSPYREALSILPDFILARDH